MKTIVKTILILLFTMPAFVHHASAQQENPVFSQAELDQMLAPIALYPDVLLSQILVASTYPMEVVEAARWSQANPYLEGEQAVAAVNDQTWDPSVKALVAFPQVLMRMNDDLNWMQALGDAFLYQEAQVMDTVQGLRQRAYEAGHLNSTENAHVIRDNRVIVIEPANPRIVYVPYYDPWVVYGSWWWPNYAPVYWGPPPGIHLNFGIYWGRGVFITPGFFFSSFDWYRRHAVVVHRHSLYYSRPHFSSGRHIRYADYPRWRHDSTHRRGIAYRHPSLQRQYQPSRSYSAPTGKFSDTRRRGDSSYDRNFVNRDGNFYRPANRSRSSGWHDYATTRERNRNEARPNTQTSRPQHNRTDAERTETRDRWRRSSGISTQGQDRNVGSRRPGTDGQGPMLRDNRSPEQTRDRSMRRETGEQRERSQSGDTRPQRSAPIRVAPQRMEPRRQTGNVAPGQTRREDSRRSDPGVRLQAEPQSRQRNRVTETSRPSRNDRRPSATPYRSAPSGASSESGRRSFDSGGNRRQDFNRGGPANRPSGRSYSREGPQRSR